MRSRSRRWHACMRGIRQFIGFLGDTYSVTTSFICFTFQGRFKVFYCSVYVVLARLLLLHVRARSSWHEEITPASGLSLFRLRLLRDFKSTKTSRKGVSVLIGWCDIYFTERCWSLPRTCNITEKLADRYKRDMSITHRMQSLNRSL